jgi:hypothetical protein
VKSNGNSLTHITHSIVLTIGCIWSNLKVPNDSLRPTDLSRTPLLISTTTVLRRMASGKLRISCLLK